MISGLLFLLAPLAFVLFGLPAFRWLSPASLPAKLGASFLLGSIAATIEMTLLSILSIPWTILSIALPLLLFSLGGFTLLRPGEEEGGAEEKASLIVRVIASVVIVAALLHLGTAFAATRATSLDYLYFWGVKGARFAEHRGIDATFLSWSYTLHAHTNYPPLVPVVFAGSALVAGKLSWRFGLLSMIWWFAAAIPLLLHLLKRHIGETAAWAATAMWTVVMAISFVHSLSAGNGEIPLVVFGTIALAAVLSRAPRSLLLAAVALGGALLTKSEAMFLVAFAAVAVAARDFFDHRREALVNALIIVAIPVLLLSPWLLFEDIYGVPMTDTTREPLSAFSFRFFPQIVSGSLHSLSAGACGLPWILALLLIIAGHRRWRDMLPGLIVSLGLLGLFIGYFFLHATEPTEWIGWILPRVSQPSLSILVITAAMTLRPEPRT